MREIIQLINQMAPFLLLGFFLAGVMHVFVPANIYGKYLGHPTFRSVVNAAILGVPLPLCSCGVIPTAMSLKKDGASKGATVAFLIATPQTGVDSIVATYSLLGLPFAVIRPIAALVTSLLGGQMVNLFDDASSDVPESKNNDEPSEASDQHAAQINKPALTFFQKVRAVFRYAYVEMMQDIGRWLVVGLVVAGLITVFVPESFFALFVDNSLLSMLLVLIFAIPMYLCATGSIPIAVALMMKGLSPGAALVLLMAGPAVNAASMLVVGKVLGRRTLIIYLASIILGAMVFGLGIDYLLPRDRFTAPIAQMAECCSDSPSWFNAICSIILLLLLANALIHRFRRKDAEGCDDACDCQHVSPVHEARYHIEGLRCNHCKANAEKAIAALDGVESVEIDLASGIATIKGHVDESELRTALAALGFKLTD